MTSENDPFDWGSFATEYMGSRVLKIVKEEIKRAQFIISADRLHGGLTKDGDDK